MGVMAQTTMHPPQAALLAKLGGQENWARRARRRRLGRGEAVWRAGDPARDFVWIEAGLVKIVRQGVQGAEAIVALFGPGDSIGDTAVLERGAYPADAIVASRAAWLVQLEAAPLMAAAAADLQWAAALRQALLAHTHALRDKIEVMTAGSVPRRLATLLLQLARRFGTMCPPDGAEIPIALSRAELAALVGATVETTIRTISRWQQEGAVTTLRQGFRIRTQRLAEIAAGG